MNLSVELAENLIALAPALLAILLVWKKPDRIAGWVAWVLGSATIAVIAMGLLLQRLTATCPDPAPSCPESERSVARIPGIFKSCFSCSADPVSDITLTLNQIAIPLQAGGAVLCIIVSFLTTIRFVLWAKRMLASATH